MSQTAPTSKEYSPFYEFRNRKTQVGHGRYSGSAGNHILKFLGAEQNDPFYKTKNVSVGRAALEHSIMG